MTDAFGPTWRDALPDALAAIGSDEVAAVQEMLTAKVNSPPTSSLGRLFDGVAAMLGVCLYNRHEAEAAAALEELADGDRADPYPYSSDQSNGVSILDPRPMIQAIARDIDAGVLPRVVSARFHQTVAAMLADLAIREAKSRSIDQIVLSGGCFSNRHLLDLTVRRVEQGKSHTRLASEGPPRRRRIVPRTGRRRRRSARRKPLMCLAVPGQIISIRDDTAQVDFQGNRRTISLLLTPETSPGDWVLVHAGFAISRLNEADARRTWRYLQEAEFPAGILDGPDHG